MALIFIAGLLFGPIIPTMCILLTRKKVPGKAGAAIIGLVATLVCTYLALRLSFWGAEQIVVTEAVPQWEAQGHLDNGPSAFIAIGMLAMPFVFGAFVGGTITSIILVVRRPPQ